MAYTHGKPGNKMKSWSGGLTCSNPSPSSAAPTCSPSPWSSPQTPCSHASFRVTSCRATSLRTRLSSRARLSSLSFRSCARGSAALRRGSRLPARALVLRYRGSDGHRRNCSQLEQRLASLVLVVLAPNLAVELLDRPATLTAASDGSCCLGEGSPSNCRETDPRLGSPGAGLTLFFSENGTNAAAPFRYYRYAVP